MKTKTRIANTLQLDKYLTFYKVMKYPVPTHFENFLFDHKTNQTTTPNTNFSRNKPNQFNQEFIDHIHKYHKIRKSLPFIKEIYLCNSITFNALHSGSDIDLFIITKKNSLWRARLFSRLLFVIKWQKRRKKKKNSQKKFCLSFYITENAQNLYDISITNTDIYLSYRLAHLVPLYQEKPTETNIYHHNSWLQNILPNLPQQHTINIWNQLYTGKTNTKKTIEILFGGNIGKLIELIIKNIRSPIVIRKKKRLWKSGRGVIINDDMLKFHGDLRKKIFYLFQLHQKNI